MNRAGGEAPVRSHHTEKHGQQRHAIQLTCVTRGPELRAALCPEWQCLWQTGREKGPDSGHGHQAPQCPPQRCRNSRCLKRMALPGGALSDVPWAGRETARERKQCVTCGGPGHRTSPSASAHLCASRTAWRAGSKGSSAWPEPGSPSRSDSKHFVKGQIVTILASHSYATLPLDLEIRRR